MSKQVVGYLQAVLASSVAGIIILHKLGSKVRTGNVTAVSVGVADGYRSQGRGSGISDLA